MHASNTAQAPGSTALAMQTGVDYAAVCDLWSGALGRTVRCVPTRRTVMATAPSGVVFGKWRRGRRRLSTAEWRWLHVLPLLGFTTPRPIAFLGQGRRTLLVTAAVPGRPMDAWFVEAVRDGWLADLVAYACEHVAPVVRSLHNHGLVHRDLYWNHVFAVEPRLGTPPGLIDLERLFRPRLLWRRWMIKDLAGLWSSLPVAVAARAGLRFLRAYLGTPLRGQRRLVAAIEAKARRIRRHVPRHGS